VFRVFFFQGRLMCVFFIKRETHVGTIVCDANTMVHTLVSSGSCASFLKRGARVRVFFEKGDSCVCLSLKGRVVCVSFFERKTHVCVFL